MIIRYEYVIYDKSFNVVERGTGFEDDNTCIRVCEDVMLKNKKAFMSDIYQVRYFRQTEKSRGVFASQYKNAQKIIITNYK